MRRADALARRSDAQYLRLDVACVVAATFGVGAAGLVASLVAVAALRDHGVRELAGITLMSDGASVYECTSDDQVIDLLRGGQGVFGIALGSVWREVEGTLAELPSERPDATEMAEHPGDELRRRRVAKKAG